MANQVGKRYRCSKCGSEFIVTRAGEGTLSCCGQPMELIGKRYRCQICGTEVLCTKASEGVVTCCGQEMEVQEPRPIPSSD